MSTIRWPPGSWIGRPAPIAAAVGSSIKYTSCALAWSAASRTARFSTWVIPDGTPITTRGRSTPQPRRRPVEIRRAARMKYLSIFCVVSKSAITPSFKGRMTRMFSGARPSIALASRPTPITAPSVRRTAMIEGSLRTMPLFRTKTSVLAVPKSIPRSVEKSSSRWSANIRVRS